MVPSAGDRPANPLDRELQEFLLDRQARNLTRKTLQWYRHSLTIWRAYLDAQAITCTVDVTPSSLRAFLVHLAERGHNPNGVVNIFGAVKAFLNWYADEYAPDTWRNPLRKVKAPKRVDEPLDALPIVSIKALLSACTARTFAGDRDRTIILTLLDTGVRHQELTDLNIPDIDLDTGAVHIRQGKGRKPRHVFIGARTRRALLVYLRWLDDDGIDLWRTEKGTRLTKAGIRQVIRRRAHDVGLTEPGMHAFRRAFAVNSLRAGMNVVTLQRLLGHSNIAVTMRYLKLNAQDLQDEHAAHGAVDHMLK